jgi:quinol monooxygenase YgiN
LNRSADDPDVFVFYEVYSDTEARAAHGASDAMKAVRPVFGSLVKESRVVFGPPINAKGLAI